MSDRIELLAILLSGFFPPLKRDASEAGSCRSVGEYAEALDLDLDVALAHERPTARLLRLVGARSIHPAES